MNNLDKYKKKMLQESRKTNADDAIESGMEAGFDAAIALNLPVKFALWLKDILYVDPQDLKVRINPDLVPIEVGGKTENLYKHWINNIYKPE